MQPRTARITLRCVGFLALLAATFGLWYNAESFLSFQSGAFDDSETLVEAPYFRAAYLTMSGICIVCYVALAICGIQFLRLESALWWLFATVAAIEVLFFMVVGASWRHPTYGLSIGAATGVSGGGLVAQWLLLFPLWAPFAVWFAHRGLRSA